MSVRTSARSNFRSWPNTAAPVIYYIVFSTRMRRFLSYWLNWTPLLPNKLTFYWPLCLEMFTIFFAIVSANKSLVSIFFTMFLSHSQFSDSCAYACVCVLCVNSMVVFRKPNYTEPVFFMGVSIAFGDLSSFSFHPI